MSPALQESFRRNGVTFTVNKIIWNTVFGCNLNNCRMILICCQGKPFSITVIQLYAPTTDTKEAVVDQIYEDLQDILKHAHTHISHFHHRGLECKNRKSRDNWRSRQVWPWTTKWNTMEANRVMWREHTGQSKSLLPRAQEMTLHMDITKWSKPKSDWLHSLQLKMELYTVIKNRIWCWLWFRLWAFYCKIQIKM